ncbi:ParB/RepB/Spo0J family partition protein [Lewinella sp. LCG006]|uniref:ParB/RepB/Spo0J family partition protein n=1 Tax=Lewinella sp. LCG006 TaxID=3231911 RepID=UPI00345FCCDC
MAKKLGTKASKQQLGSGIDALFGGGGTSLARKAEVDKAIAENPAEVVRELAKKFALIPLAHIERNPDQPRYEFDEEALGELADSIKIHGIIQPLTVRYLEPKRYQIISGERRWRASKQAGLEEVPAYIRVANDQTLLEMAIIENIQREDLNPLEIANSYNRLKQECELTDELLAERVGKKRTTITNYLRLLNLHISIQDALRKEQISMGHAKAIAGLDILLQADFLKELNSKKWSVRQTEAQVKAYQKPKKVVKQPEVKVVNKHQAEYDKILQDFKAFFGSGKVKIQVEDKTTGKGQVVIPFDDHDQLTDLFKCVEQ